MSNIQMSNDPQCRLCMFSNIQMSNVQTRLMSAALAEPRYPGRDGSPLLPPVLLAPSFLPSQPPTRAFFFLAERASSLKVRFVYRLNEGSAAACVQIVVQFTGPRSGVENWPGRSAHAPRPGAQPTIHPEFFPFRYVKARKISRFIVDKARKISWFVTGSTI